MTNKKLAFRVGAAFLALIYLVGEATDLQVLAILVIVPVAIGLIRFILNPD